MRIPANESATANEDKILWKPGRYPRSPGRADGVIAHMAEATRDCVLDDVTRICMKAYDIQLRLNHRLGLTGWRGVLVNTPQSYWRAIRKITDLRRNAAAKRCR
jgi:hypothetical protein